MPNSPKYAVKIIALLALFFCSFYSFSVFAFAAPSVTQLANYQTTNQSAFSSSITASSSRNVDDLYMVILQDQPLARYQGGRANLSATSILSNKANSLKNKSRLNVNSADSRNYLAYLQRNRQQLVSKIKQDLQINMQVENEYAYALNGFTARFSRQQIDTLKKQDSVKKVLKVTPRKLLTDVGPSFVNAPQVWQGLGANIPSHGEGVVVGIFDSGISPFHPAFAEIDGNGYLHLNPLGSRVYLGDCAKSEFARYCNNKLIGIWSHPDITNDYTPAGDDPIGIDHDGHGTHVAATAAGNVLKNVPVYNVIGDLADKPIAEISGVAPKANIVSYQVCAADFGCWPDLTALAVEHAIANGVDVINYSVGGDYTDPWSSIDALAFLSAREAGIHVAVSAGNDGPDRQTVSTPANAPWVTSVGAVNHGRDYSDITINFSGGSSSLSTFTGRAITNSVSGPIIYAGSVGDENCLTPFSAGSLTGKIVVCVRNDIPRVEKGRNVLAGGAIGMVLINDPDAPETNNLVADPHALPAIHVNNQAGQLIVDWLSQGKNHNAVISASELEQNEVLADLVASFSARGLDDIFQWLTPSVVAPGVEIYAAHSDYQPHYSASKKTEAEYQYLSGTSMSSPHVAGALALIHALKPNWTPAQAQSSLMLTANKSTKTLEDDEIVPASFFDSGAGSIRVDQAINSGLLMDVSVNEYQAADEIQQGRGADLNLPGLVDKNCPLTCSWQRTFVAAESASWTSEAQTITPNVNVSVTPSSFSLQQGQEITLTFTAEITQGFNQEFAMAEVVLTPDNNGLAPATLPVLATFVPGSFPSDIEVVADIEQGSKKLTGIKTIGTSGLVVEVYGLAKINRESVTIARDGIDNDDWPFSILNDSSSYYSQLITVPENSKYLSIEILSTSSPDLDLYFMRDSNGNGRVNANEMFDLTCQSATTDNLESCQIENLAAGDYLLLIHNFGDSNVNDNTLDNVLFEWALVPESNSQLSVDYSPIASPKQDIDLTLNWLPPLAKEQEYLSVFEIGTSQATPTDIGIVPFRFSRSSQSIALAVDKTNVTAGEDFTVSFTLDINSADSEKISQISLSLPANTLVKEDLSQGVLTGNQITWQITQPANSGVFAFQATFTTNSDLSNNLFNLAVEIVQGAETQSLSAGVLAIEAVVVTPPPSPPSQPNNGSSSSGGGTFYLLLLVLFSSFLSRRYADLKFNFFRNDK